MVYKLFGKPSCPRCTKAKRAILSAGHEVEYHDAKAHDEPQPGWRARESDFIEYKAALCRSETLDLPVILVETEEAGVWRPVEYEEALKCG